MSSSKLDAVTASPACAGELPFFGTHFESENVDASVAVYVHFSGESAAFVGVKRNVSWKGSAVPDVAAIVAGTLKATGVLGVSLSVAFPCGAEVAAASRMTPTHVSGADSVRAPFGAFTFAPTSFAEREGVFVASVCFTSATRSLVSTRRESVAALCDCSVDAVTRRESSVLLEQPAKPSASNNAPVPNVTLFVMEVPRPENDCNARLPRGASALVTRSPQRHPP
jgi:hypothetical protein